MMSCLDVAERTKGADNEANYFIPNQYLTSNGYAGISPNSELQKIDRQVEMIRKRIEKSLIVMEQNR